MMNGCLTGCLVGYLVIEGCLVGYLVPLKASVGVSDDVLYGRVHIRLGKIK